MRCSSAGAAPREGFTLIEIMIAVTIFGVISLAVYSTFRVGLKSYESGRQQMEISQTARVAFDTLARDLRSIYYLPPAAYNQDIIHQVQIRDVLKLQQALQAPNRRRAEDDDKKDEPYPGVPVDLTIIGVHNEQAGDSLTFCVHQENWDGTEAIEPWALARVKYSVQDGNLFRSEGPVTVDTVPTFQWQPPKPPPDPRDRNKPEEPPPPVTPETADHYLLNQPRELVARNVKTLDLRYGYWTEEGWFEAPDWIAHEHRFRNAPHEIDPKDPQAQIIRMRDQNRPTDDVPAYVSVTLVLGYGPEGKKTQVFRTHIRLLSALETYEPLWLLPGGQSPIYETRYGAPPAAPGRRGR